MSHHLIIGIDPGKNTGFAVWDSMAARFDIVISLMLHQAMRKIEEYQQSGDLSHVVFEDARLRKWYGAAERGSAKDIARRQGAGSIKRDCVIIAEFLGDLNIPYKSVSPLAKGAKTNAETFKRLAKWDNRTNEHARDAAMLVIGARSLAGGRNS